jgi:hypothetical protein
MSCHSYHWKCCLPDRQPPFFHLFTDHLRAQVKLLHLSIATWRKEGRNAPIVNGIQQSQSGYHFSGSSSIPVPKLVHKKKKKKRGYVKSKKWIQDSSS